MSVSSDFPKSAATRQSRRLLAVALRRLMIPAVLSIVIVTRLPESPKRLASRGQEPKPAPPLGELFRGELCQLTLVGILLASVPLICAWAGSKWMIPWAEQVGTPSQPGYQSTTQQWWAIGVVIGSFLGVPLAAAIGRRYFVFPEES